MKEVGSMIGPFQPPMSPLKAQIEEVLRNLSQKALGWREHPEGSSHLSIWISSNKQTTAWWFHPHFFDVHAEKNGGNNDPIWRIRQMISNGLVQPPTRLHFGSIHLIPHCQSVSFMSWWEGGFRTSRGTLGFTCRLPWTFLPDLFEQLRDEEMILLSIYIFTK